MLSVFFFFSDPNAFASISVAPTCATDCPNLAFNSIQSNRPAHHTHTTHNNNRGGTVRKDTGWRASRCRRKKKKPDQDTEERPTIIILQSPQFE